LPKLWKDKTKEKTMNHIFIINPPFYGNFWLAPFANILGKNKQYPQGNIESLNDQTLIQPDAKTAH
tara:strand:- start:386 stop:583 length:198 start_codon:yes stop_codon:yes gene_type:complete